MLLPLLLILAGPCALAGCIEPVIPDSGRGDPVSLVLDFGRPPPQRPTGGSWDWGNHTWSVEVSTGGSTVLAVLEAAGRSHGFDVVTERYAMGALVTAIAGLKHGEGGLYWMYEVDGVYGEVSADRASVEPGDEVRWTYGPL